MDPVTIAALGGQAVNAVSTLLTNSSQKKTSLALYDKQRADALADWNRQNQYNAPAAQMQRYKDAGLNPHLIYGQQNTAPAVRSSSVDTPKYMAPQIDPLQAVQSAQQMKLLKAQIANVEANTLKANSETNWRNVNTDWLKEVLPYKSEQEYQKGRQLGYMADKTLFEKYAIEKTLQPKINQMIANTNLAPYKQAQLSQYVENQKKVQELLGYKIQSAKYEAEVQNKIKSFGVVGSTAAQLLRLIFSR